MNSDKAMPTDSDNARLADDLERLLDRRADRIGVPGARAHDQLTRFVEHHRAAILSALRQVRAVPGGLEDQVALVAKAIRDCPGAVGFSYESWCEQAAEAVIAALSTQPPLPDDEFIHRAPTSVDPSLEGPGAGDDVTAMIERLRAKAQVSPVMGGGTISVGGGATSYITDDGRRLINPDGPEAATMLGALAAENFRLAAGQCIVENGLVGDDHGHFNCALEGRLAEQAAQSGRPDGAFADVKELAEALRGSARAFRAHNIYTQDGDPVRLLVQADECDKAATMLETLHAEIGRAVAAEREECAKVAERLADKEAEEFNEQAWAEAIATAIRDRATLAGEG